MAFNTATTNKTIKLTSQSKPSGGGSVTWQLPKVGYLARIRLKITGAVAGTLSAPHSQGMAGIVSNVQLGVNSGINLFQASGPGFHYLIRPFLESEYIDPFGFTNAKDAVTATNFDVSMIIPLAMNQRDTIGLINLASEQTTVTLTVTFEADATVATGATVTATVVPYLEIFTVPVNQEDRPIPNVLHQILEDKQAVAAAGEHRYVWPRGNTLLQIVHGLGQGASGTDGFTNFAVLANQADYLRSVDPEFLDIEFYNNHGYAREPGVCAYDLLASSGLGNYGLSRDYINTAMVTDLSSVFIATGAGTLWTVRRQLVVLGGSPS